MKQSPLKKQSGAALLIILAVVSLILPLVQGLWLDSQIEYRFKQNRMSELQAQYQAKSGLSLSLLRVYIFKGMEKSLQGQFQSIALPILDRVWAFPFMWPLPKAKDLLESEKQELESLSQQSFLKGSYKVFITPEDGLLDVNDLASPLPSLKEWTYGIFMSLFTELLEEKLQGKYSPEDMKKTLNNISDWVDHDNNSQNGGLEEFVEEGKKPLNRSFVDVEEIKKVPGMSLELFSALTPYITAHGAKGLNINYAPKGLLQALFSEELVEAILSRTQMHSEYYEPFANRESFCDFVSEWAGSSFCEGEAQDLLTFLRFERPVAFRISSQGKYKKKSVLLSALLLDLSSLALIYQESLSREKQKQEELEEKPTGESSTEKPSQQKSEPLKFDYSHFKSLVIMYLKGPF